MQFFRRAFGAVARVLGAFGDVVSSVALIVFYFTVFALFAVPYRLIARRRTRISTFHPLPERPRALADFLREY